MRTVAQRHAAAQFQQTTHHVGHVASPIAHHAYLYSQHLAQHQCYLFELPQTHRGRGLADFEVYFVVVSAAGTPTPSEARATFALIRCNL